ncbi:MAG: hypothetical protein JKY89_13745 [Immundisolibacteraceae bacterium]|nr:hypothetical protein [Immundisolibacteraceae bacterium]
MKRSLIDQHKSLLDPIRQVGDELRATIKESVAEGEQSSSASKGAGSASASVSASVTTASNEAKVVDNG